MATGTVDINAILNQTVGCLFVGLLFELLFYGVSLAQTVYYYHEYPGDRIYIRALVAIVWTLDTARTGCDLQFLWALLVDSHANLAGLTQFTKPAIAEFFLAGLITLIVQCYYIWSIWQFLAAKWPRVVLTTSMVLFALLSFCGGLVSVYDFTPDPALAATLDRMKIAASIQTVSAVVTDVYIAIALTIILRGKRTGFRGTDSLITMLVAFAIQRGVLTALMQFLHFATYIGTFKEGATKLIWALFHFPGGKIYTNSFLAVLNIRHWLREVPATRGRIEDIELATSKSGNSSRQIIRGAQIHIDREVYSDLPLGRKAGSRSMFQV
ncbi:hypothetical protein FOMPIDRAFT_1046236 [Fomitopsis schrenkii]|uniref:DUF6534 domain-containing protein n=1 Tax=Fomitopsis schrenkii TaxID=2126942 RepID=S8EGX3_FOMSC|nr:hypothetical protein FOMPIDRAFT_1046236 [Fomitopsis schrenkii]